MGPTILPRQLAATDQVIQQLTELVGVTKADADAARIDAADARVEALKAARWTRHGLLIGWLGVILTAIAVVVAAVVGSQRLERGVWWRSLSARLERHRSIGWGQRRHDRAVSLLTYGGRRPLIKHDSESIGGSVTGLPLVCRCRRAMDERIDDAMRAMEERYGAEQRPDTGISLVISHQCR